MSLFGPLAIKLLGLFWIGMEEVSPDMMILVIINVCGLITGLFVITGCECCECFVSNSQSV